jgi:hypothetical protein
MLMSDVSGVVFGAMQSLGEELDRYIAEAKGDEYKEKKEEKASRPESTGFMQKFFGDFYTPSATKEKAKKAPSKKQSLAEEKEKDADKATAKKGATADCWNTYNNFKKSRGMTAW